MNKLEELDHHIFIHSERNLSLIQNYIAKVVKIIYMCKLSPLYLVVFEVMRPYLGTSY